MLSRISNLGGRKFGVENAISNLELGGWKIWGGKCYLEISNLGRGVENLGWKMLSRISNLGGGKFGAENSISNLQFSGRKIWGGKCCLESRIWEVENLGWKMLSRISNLGGGKFGAENAISNLEFGGVENLGRKMLSRISNLGGGKFGAENAISNLEFGGLKIWGGKCYLESRIWGVENLGWKMLSRISNLGGGKFGVESAISKFLIWGGGWKIWGGKCYLESRIWGVENLGRKIPSRISNLGGGKFGAENAISNLEFGGLKIWGGKCYLESRIWGVENLGRKMLSRISNLGG